MAYMDNGPGPKLWVIYDQAHGLFWRSGGCGYTASVTDAGLFSEEFARRMTGPSYADKCQEARHLSSFSYMLREAEAQARALSERFALLSKQPESDDAVARSVDDPHEPTTRV